MNLSDLSFRGSLECPECRGRLFYTLQQVTNSGIECDTRHPAYECIRCHTVVGFLLERQPDGGLRTTAMKNLGQSGGPQ